MFESWETHMDYDGQRKSEKYSHIIVVLFGVVGWIVGYVNQQFSQTVMILGVGVIVAGLITLPPWPIYRRKPLQWRKPKPETSAKEVKENVSGTQKSKKKAKAT